MSEKKIQPIATEPKRKACPVCGKPSYSLTGTHPQCLVNKAGAVIHAAQKAAGDLTKLKVVSPSWSKP